MGPFWKALVALLLTLPVGAYVAGSLVGDRTQLPDRRAPVVVEDPADVDGSTAPAPGPAEEQDEHVEGGDEDAELDDEVEIVRPEPEDVEEALEEAREEAQDAAEDRADDRRDAREDRRDELEDARDDAADDGHDGADDDSDRDGEGDGSGSD